jgi:hypothetical protein
VDYKWSYRNEPPTTPHPRPSADDFLGGGGYNSYTRDAPAPFDGGASPSTTAVFDANLFFDSTGGYGGAAYRDPASVTLTVTDSRGRHATTTRLITFGDPKRFAYQGAGYSFALFPPPPPPDPILQCRARKACRKVVGAEFTANSASITTGAALPPAFAARPGPSLAKAISVCSPSDRAGSRRRARPSRSRAPHL